MEEKQQDQLAAVLSHIGGLQPTVAALETHLRDKIIEYEASNGDQARSSGRYWSLIAYADAMTRIKLILDQNFRFVETLVKWTPDLGPGA